MKFIVFINGPPGAGKDTLGLRLSQTYQGFSIVKFAKVLKERTHALYGNARLPHGFFEAVKDKPSEFFKGLTPREAYIAVSERYMKPLHGPTVWGEVLTDALTAEYSYARGAFVTDSGFTHEAIPVINHFGARNCLLVRIHAENRGCRFTGDSRNYIELPVETIDVTNNWGEKEFLSRATHAIDRVLQPMLAGAFE